MTLSSKVGERRIEFDAQVDFSNGGSLQTQGFRLDIPGESIGDRALSELFVSHLGLLMVGEVRISNQRYLTEPHKGSRVAAPGAPLAPGIAVAAAIADPAESADANKAEHPDPAAIFAALGPLLPELEERYRDLHANPELAFQEKRTAGIVADRLTALGWDVTTGVGRTGVVGVLRSGEGPVVMLRADMDALPVRELTGLPYASTVLADDDGGRHVPVMHACGHDLHVVALLGACTLFAAHPESWCGTLIAVFQPGEESGYGARAMVDDGLFQRFPVPDVILGQHVGPGPAGLVATCPGIVMGATDNITVRLFGRGGHGSKPESAIDPVVMAASLVMRLQTVVSRMVAAREPVVVTVGTLHAGTTAAVIPDEAELGINVRSSSAAVRERVIAGIERLARAEAEAAGAPVPPEITYIYHLPATTNDPAGTARVAAAHTEFFGGVMSIGPITASEDFGILATAAGVPSVYWFFGGTDSDQYTAAFLAGRVDEDIPQNHSATFAPMLQPTLTVGVQTLVTAALSWLAPQEQAAAPRDITTQQKEVTP